MRRLVWAMIPIFIMFHPVEPHAQSQTGPVRIKINRIIFNPGNRYAVYIPSFEFHALFQQSSRLIKAQSRPITIIEGRIWDSA
jgi:hypothetical protein